MPHPTASSTRRAPLLELARRLLLVDDNAAIHRDYERVLSRRPKPTETKLDALEALLFSAEPTPAPAPVEPPPGVDYTLVHAEQGAQAVSLVEATVRGDAPAFAVAFVDMRMPPGIDGLETIRRIWALDSRIEVVICSAFSDHSAEQIVQSVGRPEQLAFLSKPFDADELEDLAYAAAQRYATRHAGVDLPVRAPGLAGRSTP